MKMYSSLFKKHNRLSNNLQLKSLLSIVTIGIFIFFGFASITEVPYYDCEFYPQPIDKTFNVTIEIVDKETGKLIQNQNLDLVISEKEKIKSTNSHCEMVDKNGSEKTLNSGLNGIVTFTVKKTFVSKEDYILISFDLKDPTYYELRGYVDYISIYDFNPSNIKLRFGYLRKNPYP